LDIRLLPPDLRSIDEVTAELCACFVWSDERPVRGLAGLLDWRTGARLSSLCMSGFLTGTPGEAVLVPGRPHVPFEKLLLLGLGERAGYGEERFLAALTHMMRAIEGMRVRKSVVELPGRGADAIDADRAIVLALESLGPEPAHDAWWLVDRPAVHKGVEERIRSARRPSSISDR
jgi:Cytosol aminopeptidase family, N-terminal domain